MGEEGFRLLVTRYRPRGVARADETWDAWEPDLVSERSVARRRIRKRRADDPLDNLSQPVHRGDARSRQALIDDLARRRITAGEQITLLCSSACERESRCHRAILKE